MKDRIKSLSEKDSVENVKKYIDEIEMINIELEHSVANLLFENENLRKEREHLKSIYKDQFDSSRKTCVQSKEHCDSLIAQINAKSVENSDLNAQLQEKVFAIAALKNELRKLKGKMLSILRFQNLVPLLLQEWIKKLGVKPTTSAIRSKPSGNTKNNRITRPPSSNQKNKVEEHPRKVKSSLNKMNSVSEPISNAYVKHSVRNAKFESICAIYNKCLFDANHDMCVIDYVNDVNKLTRRTFTIVRNKCPLTRVTSTKEVSLKETTITPVITQSLALKVYSRKPKASKSVGSSSKAKIIESWGSTIFDVPSSSLIDCRLSKLFCGIWTSDAPSILLEIALNSSTSSVKFWVYYVEGLGHNLFSVGQICDSDLEASKTKSWLWHRRLSYLNFNYITSLAEHDLVRGLPKLKYQKDHLCSACALGKSKKYSHKPKAEDSIQEKLYLLHMDLCEPMRIQSINGRKYILVIANDYSRFTWVKFLRSKDEVLDFVIKFLKMIQVRLNATVRNIRTDNGTEFVN
ncbi:retrovirus-related pol polyprotein from transposon TNT 1-94 [Tanacetum coccineum]